MLAINKKIKIYSLSSLSIIYRRVLIIKRKYLLYLGLYVFSIFIFYKSIFFTQNLNFNIYFLRYVIIFFASVLLIKYLIYIFLSPIYHFKNKRENKNRIKYKPLVSVIVPAWNEEVGILTTINSLINNTYNNLEIIIINDGSTDNSHQKITDFVINYEKRHLSNKKRIPKIIYHYKENGGKGKALNTGIKMAKGSLIISIDADCYVGKDSIQEFVNVFKNKKVMAAVGKVHIGNTNNILGVVQYLEFLFSFYFKKSDSVMNSIYIIGGAAGAFRKKVFRTLGHYNTENITEDIELSMRIQNAGYKIVYADKAVVYTEGASSLNGLIKQRLRWKKGRFQTFSQFKHMFFSFNKNHSKVLTCIILPISIFGEIQMFFEPFFLLILYIYSVITGDYTSFISGVILVMSMFFVVYMFDGLDRKNISKVEFFFLIPIAWLLFYIATFVEFMALIKSLYSTIKKKEITWQRWDRVGVIQD